MTRSAITWILGLLFASQSVFAPSRGQPDEQPATVSVPNQSTQTSTASRAIRLAGWTVSGNLRLRFEDWDFFKGQSGESSYGFGASLLRVSLGRQFRSQDWLFEVAQPSLIGLPSQ